MMKLVVIVWSLTWVGCESQQGPDAYGSGRQDGCAEVGGTWNTVRDVCVLGPAWLMVQDAGSVRFTFNQEVDAACPSEAFWSGTLSMSDIDDETLFFTDRPYRHVFVETTAGFVTTFTETFSEASGGNPNAVLNWASRDTGRDQQFMVEIRDPVFDAASKVLVYGVCGLKLDDPSTLIPLSDEQQYMPLEQPAAQGRFSLFIDLGGKAFAN